MPNIEVIYWSMRVMAFAGVLMFLVAALGAWLYWRKKLERARWFHWTAIVAVALPYIAATAGWILTEMGRQPWIVQDLLKTADANSPAVSTTWLAISLAMFVSLYVLERFPFAADVLIAEDQDWSRRVLLAGYAIRYEPLAAMRHSHPYTLFTAFRRFFESGVAGSRTFLAGGASAQRTLRRRGLAYARGELRWLVGSGNARWIPYTCLYEGLKFAGIQLGARHERLPLLAEAALDALPAVVHGFDQRRSSSLTETAPSLARSARRRRMAARRRGSSVDAAGQ